MGSFLFSLLWNVEHEEPENETQVENKIIR